MATKEKVKAPSKGPESMAEPKKEKVEVKVKKMKEPEKVKDQKQEATPVVDSYAPKVPFHRWFKAKGFKDRWEAGMRAFTNTSQRLSMAEWDAIFKSY